MPPLTLNLARDQVPSHPATPAGVSHPPNSPFNPSRLLLALYFTLACAVPASAQNPPDPPGPPYSDQPSPPPSELLASPYTDHSFGYSIRPPADWRIFTQRQADPDGTILLRMAHAQRLTELEEIVLRHKAVDESATLPQLIEQSLHAFELEFPALKVLSRQQEKIAGLDAALISAAYQSEGSARLRIEAFLAVRAREFFVLRYDGPASRRDQSEPLFRQVVNSLALLVDRGEQSRIELALFDGRKLLDSLTSKKLREAAVPEQIFRIDRAAQPVGFIGLFQIPDVFKGNSGIRIRERGWTFESDGTAVRLQSTMFISDDLKQERWKNSTTRLKPATANHGAYLEIALEEGLRDRLNLLSKQTYRIQEPSVSNPPIEVPPTYLSRALIRMMPRLLGDLDKPRLVAFLAFDHGKAGLVLRTLDLRGSVDAEDASPAGAVYLIEEREGTSDQATKIYLDKTGRILLVKAGETTMKPAVESDLTREFGPRAAEADRLMNELEIQYEATGARLRRK